MRFARLGNNVINLEQIAYLEVSADVVTLHFVGGSEKLKFFGDEAATLTDLSALENRVIRGAHVASCLRHPFQVRCADSGQEDDARVEHGASVGDRHCDM